MKDQKTVSVVLKIVGIYSIIQSIPLLQGFTSTIGMYEFFGEKKSYVLVALIPSLIPFFLLFALGIYLIKSSESLSTRLLEKNNSDLPSASSENISDQKIQSIAFSVVGVLLFCLAMPRAMQIILNLVALNAPELEHEIPRLLRNIWPQVISVALQIVLGAILFLKSNGLAHYWHKLQATRPMEKNS